MDEPLLKPQKNKCVDLAPVHVENRRQPLQKISSCLKSHNLSVDVHDVRKEVLIVSSPSLDSSLRIEESRNNEDYLGLPKGPGSALSLALPPHTPLTPHSPGSVFLSQTSQDSGFQSALSFDLAAGSDANSRRRTTTSLTSAVSDWHNSVDSDFAVPNPIEKTDGLSSEKSDQNTSNESLVKVNASELETKDLKKRQKKPPANLRLDMEFLRNSRKEATLNRAHVTSYADKIIGNIVEEAICQSLSFDWNIKCSEQCSEESCREDYKDKQSKKASHKKIPSKDLSARFSSCSSTLCWTPEIPYSPSHHPTSRRSSVSQSHDSLVCGTAKDESHLITSAISHGALGGSHDIYSSPVDTLKPYQGRIFQPKAILHKDAKVSKRLTSNPTVESRPEEMIVVENGDTGLSRNKCFDHSRLYKMIPFCSVKPHRRKETRKKSKSFSSVKNAILSLFTFRRSSKEVSCVSAKNEFIEATGTDSPNGIKWGKICPLPSAPPLRANRNSAFTDPVPTTVISKVGHTVTVTSPPQKKNKPSPHFLPCLSHSRASSAHEGEPRSKRKSKHRSSSRKASRQRALPPLPDPAPEQSSSDMLQHKKVDDGCDFASIIEKVKDYGWYWGPISGEAAEKVLFNEPDGSFIVRDSSDHHYIFSLTFRLNGLTRHVRIEHDQGNFSFGGYTRFKSQTIVDFIEKAVEHSRSGRYLFFLHRRPVLGPMRVQLLHPVSRFKHVQSLQHLCRFIIVKQVRRDLIEGLPLPQRLKDYLNSPHYYSELVEQCMTLETEESPDIQSAPAESPSLSHHSGNQATEPAAIAGPSSASPTFLRLDQLRRRKLPLLASRLFKESPETMKCPFYFKSEVTPDDTFLQGGPLYPLSPSTLFESNKRSLFVPCAKSSWINSWHRGSDSHLASVYSSPTSLQFSVTSPEFDSSTEPIVMPVNTETMSRPLTRSFSTGCIWRCRTTECSSSLQKHSLVSALALDTTVSEESA